MGRTWLSLSLFLSLICRGEVIDRIAVSVGNQVITEAQILDELRITAFLNNQKPELTSDNKKAAAERLIEQALVKREMELSRFPLPDQSQAAPLEKDLRAKYGSDAQFDQALAQAGIEQKNLEQHLWWQLTMLRFIDYRFRPSVQVPDTAVKTYYERKRTEWEQQGVKPIPTLEDSRADIERILTEQRVDRAMDRWLGDTRTHIAILYRKEAFE
jgi:hypothetical protein